MTIQRSQPWNTTLPWITADRLLRLFIGFESILFVEVSDSAEVCEMDRQNRLSSVKRNQKNLPPMIRSRNSLSPVIKSFFLFEYWGVESILGPLGTAATPGLLYLSRVIVKMEKLVEWTILAGETEILGKNLPRLHFLHHKSHLPDPGAKLVRLGGKPATNSFSYDVVM
jgi:hypothetical protein